MFLFDVAFVVLCMCVAVAVAVSIRTKLNLKKAGFISSIQRQLSPSV